MRSRRAATRRHPTGPRSPLALSRSSSNLEATRARISRTTLTRRDPYQPARAGMLHQGSFTPVVHQPTRTVANGREILLGRMPQFTGISEHRRTSATPCLRLHTAEVAGSKPASRTQKTCRLAGKPPCSESADVPPSTLLTRAKLSTDVPALHASHLRRPEGRSSRRASRAQAHVRGRGAPRYWRGLCSNAPLKGRAVEPSRRQVYRVL